MTKLGTNPRVIYGRRLQSPHDICKSSFFAPPLFFFQRMKKKMKKIYHINKF